jgi:pimeloyl-ACP methyl ester carboxylesterase
VNVVVDGLLTNYTLSGHGSLIVLLHGWGDSAHGLADLQTELAANYQVLSLDLPGFGATQPPAEAWKLDNYAAFVQSLLKKLGLKQPYAVIGHSNGGAIAVRGVSLGLLQPKKLVLIAASGVRTGQTGRRFVLKIIAKTGNVATMWMPERYRRSLRKSLYGAAGSDMLVAPQLKETFKQTVRQDVQADASGITIPTLLVYARDDPAVPLTDGRTYQQLIKHSQLEIIDEAGHFVHHDQPALVSKVIKEFLA